jgi:hypothetical protein
MFPLVVIDLGAAVICFMSACYPALVGINTPKGEFQLTHYETRSNGFGGDILVFLEPEDGDNVFAVHRVIDVKGQNRMSRLTSGNDSDRKPITLGCVNVMPDVYDKLVECCAESKVTIK